MKRLAAVVLGSMLSVLVAGCGYHAVTGVNPPGMVPEIKVSAYDNFRDLRKAEKHPGLIVGAAVVDLTPVRETGVWVAGYMPNKRSTGIHTPITGRVLYLDNGQNAVAIVSLDYVGLMRTDIDAVRARLTRKYGTEVVMMSIHNHAGPDVMGMWGRAIFYMIPVENGRDEGYMQRAHRSLAEGILQAQRTAVPAQLTVATAEGPAGYCDNWHRPGVWDSDVTALMAQDMKGAPISTLINWNCHAEFLGAANSEISADFPYYVYERVEQSGGGVAVYTNGALGGLVTAIIDFERKNLPVPFRKKVAKSAGYAVADAAMDALVSKGERITSTELNHHFGEVDIAVNNWRFLRIVTEGIFHRPVYTHNNDGKTYLRTELHAINIGPLAMGTVPGEFFPSLGFGMKRQLMGAKHNMLFGLGGDELGYIMLPQEFDDELYNYEITVSMGRETGVVLWKSLSKLWGKPGLSLPPVP